MKETPEHIEAVKSIQKKLLGKRLTYREIYTLMDEIAHDRLGDILTTYFVASSFKEGFSPDELYYLTKAMVETGVQLHIDGVVADKHSTGGLAGTRTTMIVVPIVAAAGIYIPKTSSRAITSPAGTADVMEVIAPVTFSPHEIERMVHKVGGCIVWGGKLGIAPADDIIIEVEDELSFESYDKVIVSIMAKKVAVGANHLILDIPVGKTMKIKHKTDAEKVAKKFLELGRRFNVDVEAYVNESIEPAGKGIGPALEAVDVLQVLEQHPDRPMPLEEKALLLAGKLLNLCYKGENIKKDGYKEAQEILQSGRALTKFREIVREQKGHDDVTSKSLVPNVHKHEVLAGKHGIIKHVNNINLNTVAKVLGAPAEKSAGLVLNHRITDKVSKHEPLMTFYAKDKHKIKEALDTLVHIPIYEIET